MTGQWIHVFPEGELRPLVYARISVEGELVSCVFCDCSTWTKDERGYVCIYCRAPLRAMLPGINKRKLVEHAEVKPFGFRSADMRVETPDTPEHPQKQTGNGDS